ncbi:hypothetical protein CBR_g37455 [Chara braunii]|uniref:Protein kinase domain-containing protein n=1 Tax=Chara braunii TaxID=69332 RepID=A0A388LN59_CHABU|nr:hypothetical protein CBR_g37455 [Chara braunii]|eukprot:GBG83653.1 hypothetical protein CBR_g37455 [Chara braunii]
MGRPLARLGPFLAVMVCLFAPRMEGCSDRSGGNQVRGAAATVLGGTRYGGIEEDEEGGGGGGRRETNKRSRVPWPSFPGMHSPPTLGPLGFQGNDDARRSLQVASGEVSVMNPTLVTGISVVVRKPEILPIFNRTEYLLSVSRLVVAPNETAVYYVLTELCTRPSLELYLQSIRKADLGLPLLGNVGAQGEVVTYSWPSANESGPANLTPTDMYLYDTVSIFCMDVSGSGNHLVLSTRNVHNQYPDTEITLLDVRDGQWVVLAKGNFSLDSLAYDPTKTRLYTGNFYGGQIIAAPMMVGNGDVPAVDEGSLMVTTLSNGVSAVFSGRSFDPMGRCLYFLDDLSSSSLSRLDLQSAEGNFTGLIDMSELAGSGQPFGPPLVTSNGCNLFIIDTGGILHWITLDSRCGRVRTARTVANVTDVSWSRTRHRSGFDLHDNGSAASLYLATDHASILRLELDISALHSCDQSDDDAMPNATVSASAPPPQSAPTSLPSLSLATPSSSSSAKSDPAVPGSSPPSSAPSSMPSVSLTPSPTSQKKLLPDKPRDAKANIILVVSVVVPIAICVVSSALVAGVVLFRRRSRRRRQDATASVLSTSAVKHSLHVSRTSIEEDGSAQRGRGLQPAGVKEFSLEQLAHCTNNFDHIYRVGEKGAFGEVFWGSIADRQVAIKVMMGELTPEKRQQFVAEVNTLSRLHHANLIELIGFCQAGDRSMLVYPFFSGGSLHARLHNRGGIPGRHPLPPLTLGERVSIAYQIASGLSYLHHGANPPVIHRDIKSLNVLLTDGSGENLHAVLADFGLAAIGQNIFETTRKSFVETSHIAGTHGYMAPEYCLSGRLTLMNDVYAFGVIVLELLSGRRAATPQDPSSGGGWLTIVGWANDLAQRADCDLPWALLDDHMRGEVESNLKSKHQAQELTSLAMDCVHLLEESRPTMKVVLHRLESIGAEMVANIQGAMNNGSSQGSGVLLPAPNSSYSSSSSQGTGMASMSNAIVPYQATQNTVINNAGANIGGLNDFRGNQDGQRYSKPYSGNYRYQDRDDRFDKIYGLLSEQAEERQQKKQEAAKLELLEAKKKRLQIEEEKNAQARKEKELQEARLGKIVTSSIKTVCESVLGKKVDLADEDETRTRLILDALRREKEALQKADAMSNEEVVLRKEIEMLKARNDINQSAMASSENSRSDEIAALRLQIQELEAVRTALQDRSSELGVLRAENSSLKDFQDLRGEIAHLKNSCNNKRASDAIAEKSPPVEPDKARQRMVPIGDAVYTPKDLESLQKAYKKAQEGEDMANKEIQALKERVARMGAQLLTKQRATGRRSAVRRTTPRNLRPTLSAIHIDDDDSGKEGNAKATQETHEVAGKAEDTQLRNSKFQEEERRAVRQAKKADMRKMCDDEGITYIKLDQSKADVAENRARRRFADWLKDQGLQDEDHDEQDQAYATSSEDVNDERGELGPQRQAGRSLAKPLFQQPWQLLHSRVPRQAAQGPLDQRKSESTGVMARQPIVLTPEEVAIQQAAVCEAQLQKALGDIKVEKERMIRRRARVQRRQADIAEVEGMDLTNMDADVRTLRSALLSIVEVQDQQTDLLTSIQQSLAVLVERSQAAQLPSRPGVWPGIQPPPFVPPVTGVSPYVTSVPVQTAALSMPLTGGFSAGLSVQVPIQTLFTQPPLQTAMSGQPVVSQSVQQQGTQPMQQQVQQPAPQGPQPLVGQVPGKTQWVPKTAIAAPKPFTGDKKGEDLDTWLRSVPVYVRCKLTLPHEEVLVAASYLEGSAARWWSGLVQLQGYGHDFRAWSANQKLDDFIKLVEERWHDPQEAQKATDTILTLSSRQFKSVRDATDAVERLICVPIVRYDPQVLLTTYLRCLPMPLRNQLASEANINVHNFPSFNKKARDLEAKIGHGHTPTTDGRRKSLPPNWKAKGRIMFVDKDGYTIELDDDFQKGVGAEAGSIKASGGEAVAATVQQKVTIDASQYDIGAVLAQQEGKKLRPVEYMSKKMPSQKLTKSTYEKELYAILKALTHWRHYLLGRFFYVRTDHQTLRWMKNQPVLSDALKRWIEVIEQYDFVPQYIKGEYNKVADALSRRPNFSSALITEFGLEDNVTQSLVEAYREDQFMSEIIRRLEAKDKSTSTEFQLGNGMLFLEKEGNKRLCVPDREPLRSLLLGECHNATGHFGFKKTAANLLQRFWWPTMMKDAKLYVETCQVCQRDKPCTQAPLGLLKPLPILERPGESLSMDFMGTLVTSKSGMRYVYVIVDRFSKYARLVAMPATAKTEYVIKLFKEKRDFGLPKYIVSDRDVRFTSELWKAAAAEQGTQLQMTSGNHPEANGQAEQLNRAVQHLLRHYIKPNQVDWMRNLPSSSACTTMQCTPLRE